MPGLSFLKSFTYNTVAPKIEAVANELNLKQPNMVLISGDDGKVATSEVSVKELNFLNNVNNNIQTQLNAGNTTMTNTSNELISRVQNVYSGLESNILATSNNVLEYLNIDSMPNGEIFKYVENGFYYGDLNIAGNLTVKNYAINDGVSQSFFSSTISDVTEIASDSLNGPVLKIIEKAENNIIELGHGTETKVTMTHDGKLGIGTTTPVTTLDINGNIVASGTINGMTTQELSYLSGATDNIQSQIDNFSTLSGTSESSIGNLRVTSSSNMANNITNMSNITVEKLSETNSNLTNYIKGVTDQKQDTINFSKTFVKNPDDNSISVKDTIWDTINSSNISYRNNGNIVNVYDDNITINSINVALMSDVNSKQDLITGAATTITTNLLPANKMVVSDANGKVASHDFDIAKIDNLTGTAGTIQTQIDDIQTNMNSTTNELATKRDTEYINIVQYVDSMTASELAKTDGKQGAINNVSGGSLNKIGNYITYNFSQEEINDIVKEQSYWTKSAPEDEYVSYSNVQISIDNISIKITQPFNEPHIVDSGIIKDNTSFVNLGNNEYIYSFKNTSNDVNSISFPQDTVVDVLIVAGGGAGGSGEDGVGGGGGGGSVYVASNMVVPANTEFPIIVGKGGKAAFRENGGNSSAFGITAIGGGAGGNSDDIHGIGSSGTGGGGGINYYTSNVGMGGIVEGTTSKRGADGVILRQSDTYHVFPRENMDANTFTYTDGIPVACLSSTVYNEDASHEPFKLFDGVLYSEDTNSWLSGNDTYDESGNALVTYLSEYPGEWVMIDLGEDVILKETKLYPLTAQLVRQPKEFRIYGTNDKTAFGDINDNQWNKVYDGVNPNETIVNLSSTTYVAGKYPREPLVDYTTTYTDGTVVKIRASSEVSTRKLYHSFNNTFVNIDPDYGWASASSTYTSSTGNATQTHLSDYDGEYFTIDLGEQIILDYIKIHPRTDIPLRCPKKFKIYASNSESSYLDINDSGWVEIFEGIDTSDGSQTAPYTYTIDNKHQYRYYTMVINKIFANTGNQNRVQFAEIEFYSKSLTISDTQPIITKSVTTGFYNVIYDDLPNTWNEMETIAINNGGRLPTKTEMDDYVSGINNGTITVKTHEEYASDAAQHSVWFAISDEGLSGYTSTIRPFYRVRDVSGTLEGEVHSNGANPGAVNDGNHNIFKWVWYIIEPTAQQQQHEQIGTSGEYYYDFVKGNDYQTTLVKYPREALTGSTHTYTDGTVVRLNQSSQYNSDHNPLHAFNHNVNDNGWACKAKSYNPSNGETDSSYRTDYNGEYVIIDLGEKILVDSIKIYPRNTFANGKYRRPKIFRIYASNDIASFDDINDSNWNLIYEGNNTGDGSESTAHTYIINKTVRYQYYSIIINKIFVNIESKVAEFAELEFYGNPVQTTLVKYPRELYTAPSDDITYSSKQDEAYTDGWRSFDGSKYEILSCYISGPFYNGGTHTGSENIEGYSGEWLRIDLKENIILKNYYIYPEDDYPSRTERGPRDFAIFASKDNITHVKIDEQTDITYSIGQRQEFNLPDNNESYRYYTIIVNKITMTTNNAQFFITEWELYGYPVVSSNANYTIKFPRDTDVKLLTDLNGDVVDNVSLVKDVLYNVKVDTDGTWEISNESSTFVTTGISENVIVKWDNTSPAIVYDLHENFIPYRYYAMVINKVYPSGPIGPIGPSGPIGPIGPSGPSAQFAEWELLGHKIGNYGGGGGGAAGGTGAAGSETSGNALIVPTSSYPIGGAGISSSITKVVTGFPNRTDDMLAWYKFDGANGEIDSSGNDKTATVFGSPVPSETSLTITKDNYLKLPGNIIDFENDICISLWYRFDNSDVQHGSLIDFAKETGFTNVDNTFHIARYNNTELKFKLDSEPAIKINFGHVTNGPLIHVTWVIKKDGTFIIYKNGIQVYNNVHVYPKTNVYSHSYLGKVNYSSQFNTNHQITLRDFRIYNRALTPDEVTELYEFNKPKFAEESTDLLMWYKFDKPDVAEPDSYTINSGTLGITHNLENYDTLQESSYGVVGNAHANLNKAYLQINSDFDSSSLNECSICFWLKKKGINTASDVILADSSTSSEPFKIRRKDTTDYWDIQCFGGVFDTDGYLNDWKADHIWNHYSFIFENASGSTQLKIYKNNTLVYTNTNGTWTNTIITKPTIGDTNPYSSLMGNLDDIRVYNRVLTTTELHDLYNYRINVTNYGEGGSGGSTYYSGHGGGNLSIGAYENDSGGNGAENTGGGGGGAKTGGFGGDGGSGVVVVKWYADDRITYTNIVSNDELVNKQDVLTFGQGFSYDTDTNTLSLTDTPLWKDEGSHVSYGNVKVYDNKMTIGSKIHGQYPQTGYDFLTDTSDMLAWYKFDGDGNDSSGNGNHLSYHTLDPSTGSTINALTPLFTTEDYITGTSSFYNDITRISSRWETTKDIIWTPDITICMWLKINVENANPYDIVFHSITSPYGVKYHAGNNITGTTNAGVVLNGDGTTFFGTNSNVFKADSKWHFHVLTGKKNIDNTINVNLYIDNILIETWLNKPFNDTPQKIQVMGYKSLGTSTTTIDGISSKGYGTIGKLDDFRIYNRALTPDEVTILYNNKAAVYVPVSNNFLIDTSDMYVWYKFNGDLNDDSGYSRDAIGYNSPTFDSTLKKEGTHSVQFAGGAAGTDSQYLTIPSTDFSLWDGFTVSCWVMFEDDTSDGRIFDFGDGQDANNIVLARNGSSNKMLMSIRQDTFKLSSSPLNYLRTSSVSGGITDIENNVITQSFTFKTASISSTSAFFRNEDFVASCTTKIPSSGLGASADGILMEVGGTAIGFFLGIRENGTKLRMRAGTSSASGNNIVSGTDTIVLDIPYANYEKYVDENTHEIVWEVRVGNQGVYPGRLRLWIDGELIGSATTTGTNNRLNGGYWSGTDDGGFGTISDTNFNFLPTGEPTNDWVIAAADVSNLNYYRNRLVSEDIATSYDIVTTNDVIVNNTWMHISWVITKTPEWKLYVNGVLQPLNSSNSQYPVSTTYDNCYIAKSNSAADGYFKGKMDDFRIYKRALSDGEAKALYDMEIPTYSTGELYVNTIKAKEITALGVAPSLQIGNHVSVAKDTQQTGILKASYSEPVEEIAYSPPTMTGTYNTDSFLSPDDNEMYEYAQFTDDGTITFPQDTVCDILMVGGGGGGGGRHGGGGGAGGLIYETNVSISSGTYSVIVGEGGIGGDSGVSGNSGENSSVFDFIALGGGGGGGRYSPDNQGKVGGSGGGGASGGVGGLGTLGMGNNGGNASSTSYWNHAGGGGAGTAGSSATSTSCGDGGDGLEISITGIPIYYAGGGGGGSHPPNPSNQLGGKGGLGGGGDGGVANNTDARGESGVPNTGGGGGGSSAVNGSVSGAKIGGNGGSGIVIIRWKKIDENAVAVSSKSENIKIMTIDSRFTNFKQPTVQNATNNQIIKHPTEEAYYTTFTDTTAPGSITFEQDTVCDILMVGGGGAGSGQHGGGGGAGKLILFNQVILSKGTYVINIGEGGTCPINAGPGEKGGNTEIKLGNIVLCYAEGGGGAGRDDGGEDGGSGAGGDAYTTRYVNGDALAYNPVLFGISGTALGNDGGNHGLYDRAGHGGGGGGSGTIGETALGGESTGHGGAGGDGVYIIDGINLDTTFNLSANNLGVDDGTGHYYLAGGGGGGTWGSGAPAGSGGKGGGGAGGQGGNATSGNNGANAIANTGSGGGGGSDYPNNKGGNGGSGIVIIKWYPTKKAVYDSKEYCLRSKRNIWMDSANVIWTSDIRIKKDIEDINDDSALEQVMRLEPKTYKYKNAMERGNNKIFGFISQQVENVIPEATTKTTNFIPNIYEHCEFTNTAVNNIPHSTITLPVDYDIATLSIAMNSSNISTRVRVINEKNENAELDFLLTSNVSGYGLMTEDISEFTNNSSNVFVYGTEVEDLTTIDKSYLYTLNVCATHVLSRKIDTLEASNSAMVSRIEQLESELNTLQNSFK
mgnify:CR=1 FL=1